MKTRLSPAVPAALAFDLYRALLDDAIAVTAGAEADEHFLYWAGAPAAGDGPGVPTGFRVREQQGRDLGERLERAFGELIVSAADRAVVVGADCPALEPSVIGDAFAALESHDAVLGPARDGGYYLVGLSRLAPDLFHAIEWSTPRVLEQTLARAAKAGLTTALLEALDDFDTPEDLLRWIACRAAGKRPRAARALDAALRTIGLLPPG